jgi:hypothetical protein
MKNGPTRLNPKSRVARLGAATGLTALLVVILVLGVRETATTLAATPNSQPSDGIARPATILTDSLLIATSPDYWPMEYISGTQIVGHDIDLMNSIAAAISVTVVYTDVPFGSLFSGLIAGEYDAVVAGLTVTPQREEEIDFTLPYVVTTDEALNEGHLAIAVQQGNHALRYQMNEALCQLRIDGTLESISTAIATDRPEWQPRLPDWSCASVSPGAESTLVFTDTQGSPTIVQMPANTVSETTTLVYTSLATVTAPSDLSFAGHAFDLDAYRSGTFLLPGYVLSAAITVTLHYTDSDVMGLDEASLLLEYWNNAAGAWTGAACGAYVREPDHNRLAVPICHLSRFALFGKGNTVFIPVALKGQ